MPELPEVENVRQTLIPFVVGNTIEKIDVHYAPMIKEPDDTNIFIHLLQGETIEDVKRRGKFLLFYTNQFCFISHLRMEGKYKYVPSEEEATKHVHVEFYFTNGNKLQYHDVRKFGTFHLYNKGEEIEKSSVSKLGVEPFIDEWESFDLYERIKKSTRPIKNILLDQTIIAGLGNIYVDEVLYLAHIHPLTKATQLTEEEAVRIKDAAAEVLQNAVKRGGSTIRTYENTQGKRGSYQDYLKVYGRKGELCSECHTEIEKIKLSGRGTHFCPNCQKEKPND